MRIQKHRAAAFRPRPDRKRRRERRVRAERARLWPPVRAVRPRLPQREHPTGTGRAAQPTVKCGDGVHPV